MALYQAGMLHADRPGLRDKVPYGTLSSNEATLDLLVLNGKFSGNRSPGTCSACMTFFDAKLYVPS